MAKWTRSQRETFEALRRAYLAHVPARLTDGRDAAAAAVRAGAPPRALEELRDLAHRLVGSSAIFGLPKLSAAARELEDRAAGPIEGAAGAAGLEELAAAVESVWRETDAARRDEP